MKKDKNTHVPLTHSKSTLAASGIADNNILAALKMSNQTLENTYKNVCDILGQDEKKEINAAALLKVETLFHLKDSYERQVSRYRSLGWLVVQDGKEGTIGVDKNFYVLPTLDQVLEALAEQIELLTYKHSQGFKKFMLVPFGMSHVEMYKKLHKEYKRYVEDPELGLYCTDLTRTRLTKIKEVPFSINTESEEAILYYPETLYTQKLANCQAKSKSELLKESRFAGWELHLLPENILLRKFDSTVIGDRPVFETGDCFSNYLDQMKGRAWQRDEEKAPVLDAEGNNVYRGEAGLTLDLWIAWALEELYTKNQVLHDCGGEDVYEASPILIGSIIGSYTDLPEVITLHFSTYEGLVDVSSDYPECKYRDGTAVSSVKVC